MALANDQIKRQLRMGHPELRLLYTTPETLFAARYSADFDIAYKQQQIVRLVVDEVRLLLRNRVDTTQAHVIEEWGSTFRPVSFIVSVLS